MGIPRYTALYILGVLCLGVPIDVPLLTSLRLMLQGLYPWAVGGEKTACSTAATGSKELMQGWEAQAYRSWHIKV